MIITSYCPKTSLTSKFPFITSNKKKIHEKIVKFWEWQRKSGVFREDVESVDGTQSRKALPCPESGSGFSPYSHLFQVMSKPKRIQKLCCYMMWLLCSEAVITSPSCKAHAMCIYEVRGKYHLLIMRVWTISYKIKRRKFHASVRTRSAIPGIFLAFLEWKLRIQSLSNWECWINGWEKLRIALCHCCRLPVAISSWTKGQRPKNKMA